MNPSTGVYKTVACSWIVLRNHLVMWQPRVNLCLVLAIYSIFTIVSGQNGIRRRAWGRVHMLRSGKRSSPPMPAAADTLSHSVGKRSGGPPPIHEIEEHLNSDGSVGKADLEKEQPMYLQNLYVRPVPTLRGLLYNPEEEDLNISNVDDSFGSEDGVSKEHLARDYLYGNLHMMRSGRSHEDNNIEDDIVAANFSEDEENPAKTNEDNDNSMLQRQGRSDPFMGQSDLLRYGRGRPGMSFFFRAGRSFNRYGGKANSHYFRVGRSPVGMNNFLRAGRAAVPSRSMFFRSGRSATTQNGADNQAALDWLAKQRRVNIPQLRSSDGFNHLLRSGRSSDGFNHLLRSGRSVNDGFNHLMRSGRSSDAISHLLRSGRSANEGFNHLLRSGRSNDGINHLLRSGRSPSNGINHLLRSGRSSQSTDDAVYHLLRSGRSSEGFSHLLRSGRSSEQPMSSYNSQIDGMNHLLRSGRAVNGMNHLLRSGRSDPESHIDSDINALELSNSDGLID